MLVSEVFELLSQGEFQSLSLGGSEESGVLAHEYRKIIPHLNLGVQKLYERFNLDTRNLTLETVEELLTYPIDLKFAESNIDSLEPIKYIKDTDDPFTGRLLKIESLAKDGVNIKLNDRTELEPVYTFKYNTLDFTKMKAAGTYVIQYRTKPAAIPILGLDPTTVEVELPIPYLEPLLFFIASRTMQGPESMEFLSKYENSCMTLETVGLTITEGTNNHKFRMQGFI